MVKYDMECNVASTVPDIAVNGDLNSNYYLCIYSYYSGSKVGKIKGQKVKSLMNISLQIHF